MANRTHPFKASRGRSLSDRWWLIALAVTALLLVTACVGFIDYEQRKAHTGHVVSNLNLEP